MARPQFHILGTEKDAQTVDLDELYDLINQYKFRHRHERKLNRLPALAEMLKLADTVDRHQEATAGAEGVKQSTTKAVGNNMGRL